MYVCSSAPEVKVNRLYTIQFDYKNKYVWPYWMISIQFNDLFIENIFFAATIDGVSKIMNKVR